MKEREMNLITIDFNSYKQLKEWVSCKLLEDPELLCYCGDLENFKLGQTIVYLNQIINKNMFNNNKTVTVYTYNCWWMLNDNGATEYFEFYDNEKSAINDTIQFWNILTTREKCKHNVSVCYGNSTAYKKYTKIFIPKN